MQTILDLKKELIDSGWWDIEERISSYGWGDGQWMRDWQERTAAAGAVLYQNEGLIVNEMPDEAGLTACRTFGAGFAGA